MFSFSALYNIKEVSDPLLTLVGCMMLDYFIFVKPVIWVVHKVIA